MFDQVKLSEKLTHVQSLCIHEMIVRAFKHIIRSIIAASSNMGNLALLISEALNMMLGVSEIEEEDINISLVSRWLKTFLKKRYEWELTRSDYKEVRKNSILRGLCHKVGIELSPKDYNMNSPAPFRKSDIISLVPVHKVGFKIKILF